jgi:tetratricopeptide (TPR) repeat protein
MRRWKYPLVLAMLALLAVAGIIVIWVKHVSSSPSGKASGLGFSLPSTGAGAASSHAPANREAEEFYLKGRYYWEKRTPDSLNKAVDSFTQAIVHDPSYAPAYVGLADCYNLLREYTVMPASEAYPRALAAAKKAVELDDKSSEAHASLAFVSFYGMWDAATADREFRRALELNPNNVIAHHWYATYLLSLRHYPESLAEIERAQALDPASKSVLADKGEILFDAGHLLEAIALLRQMEENEPDFISPHRYLKVIYLLTADYPHYLSEAKKEAELMKDSTSLAIAKTVEKSYASGGGNGLLETLRQQQIQLYKRGLLTPYYLAETYSILGNRQEALRYLRIAYDRHAQDITGMASDHAFDILHDEPAYRKLLVDAGLSPSS